MCLIVCDALLDLHLPRTSCVAVRVAVRVAVCAAVCALCL